MPSTAVEQRTNPKPTAPLTADRVVDGSRTNPFLVRPPEPEAFDFHGFRVSNTTGSANAAMKAVVLGGGIEAAHRQLMRVRISVAAFADSYEGRGDADHDRRAAAGRDVLAKLETAYASLARMQTATVDRFVQSGVGIAKAAIASSRRKLSAAKSKYGIVVERWTSPKTGFVHATYAMSDDADARDLSRAAGRLGQLRDRVLAARRNLSGAQSNTTYTGDSFETWHPVSDTPAQAASKLVAAEAAWAEALAGEMKKDPVLALFQRVEDAGALDALAMGPSPEAARALSNAIGGIDNNLRKVERELDDDPSIVLSMPRIVDAVRAVSSTPTALERRMIGDAVVVASEAKEKADAAVAVISIALGIAAAIPSGGAGFVIAAGAAAAFDVADFVRELDDYQTKSAFAGTDFDQHEALGGEPSATGVAMAAVGALASAFGVVEAASELGKAMRSDILFASIAKRLTKELSVDEVKTLFATLGKEALENLGIDLTGPQIARLVERHSAARVRRFGEALPGRQAERLLDRLSTKSIDAIDGVDPKAIHHATIDIGLENLDALAPHLGGEAVVRMHRQLGDSLLGSELSVVDGYVQLDDIVRVPVADFMRVVDGQPEALGRVAIATRSIRDSGGLADASLAQLGALAKATKEAGVPLPAGLTPIAREKLAFVLHKAGKLKGAASDTVVRQVLVHGVRLDAFDPAARALPADAVVVDSQLLISHRLMKENGYASLQPGQQAAATYVNGVDASKIYVSDASFLEARGAAQYPGFEMTVSREGGEYEAVVAKLTQKAIGKPKGGADRAVVADLLFAKVEGGGPATLVVQDIDVFKRLYNGFGVGVDETLVNAKAIQRTYGRTGFLIEIDGHQLRVVPVAAEPPTP